MVSEPSAAAAAAAIEAALIRYYDQEAADRAERAVDPQRAEARASFVDRLSADVPPRPLLEVGIGPGRDAATFVSCGIVTVGVDLSWEHARRATSLGAGVAVGSVRALPFAGGSFDALWSMSTLMHVPDVAIEGALAELRRVLAPGARAAIGVWGGPDVEHHSDADRYDPPRFFSRRSDERWRSLLGRRLGEVESFEAWPGDDEFWYQWAVVRC